MTSAHNHCIEELPLPDAAVRYRLLDADLYDVTNPCITALGATEDLDTLNSAGAAVIRNIEHGLDLNHLPVLSLLTAAQYSDQTPRLVLGQWPTLFDNHFIAFFALVLLIMGVQLGRATDVFLVKRVLQLSDNLYRDGLIHTGTQDTAL
jgi:hypothetical protein